MRVGEKLYPKPNTRKFMSLPNQYRYVVVKEFCDRGDGIIETEDGEYKWTGSLNYPHDYYIPGHVNSELSYLLDKGVEFKSINAVTVDGKVIQIESTE